MGSASLRRMVRMALALAAAGSVGVLAQACGTSGESGSNFPTPGSDGGTGGGFLDADFGDGARVGYDPDAFFVNDPPPAWCGPAGGATQPPAPGGTPECPDDKNREGCPCAKAGEQKACWTGARKNRNLGICKDGVATCERRNEVGTYWGPCVGAVLPKPEAKLGADACKCFSKGQWTIPNVSPCFITGAPPNDKVVQKVHSTYLMSDAGNQAQCEFEAPSINFSTNSLNVDCEGHFKLCFAIKAGEMEAAKPSDCKIMEVCTEGEYPVKNKDTAFPPLGAWHTTDVACGQNFFDHGGYGELTVKGLSYACDAVDDGSGNSFVFKRFNYCAFKCNAEPAKSSDPECIGCTNGATGEF